MEEQSYRVMIVEDDHDTARLVSRQLGKLSAEFITVHNGQDAILAIGSVLPDLLVLDIMMPALDGLEVLRFLKRKFADQYVPIIMLTARHSKDDVDLGAEYGCDDYITKPYHRGRIVESAERLLRMARLEGQYASLQEGQEDAEDDTQGSDDVEGVRGELVSLRLSMGQMLIKEDKRSVALGHVERAQALDEDNQHALELLERIRG